MRTLKPCVACILLLAIPAGCQKPAKLTQQEAAVAAETTEQMNASAGAVAQSRYRRYRWLTDEEMVHYRLGYDPSMSAGTRYAVEQTVDDNLADKGFHRGEPADFVVAFSDIYIDRNRSAPGGAFEGPAMEVTESVSGSQMQAYDDMEVYRTPEEAVYHHLSRCADAPPAVARQGTRALRSMAGTQSDEAIETAVHHALNDMPVPLAP